MKHPDALNCCWYHANMNRNRYTDCRIPDADRCEAVVKDCYGRTTDLRCTHHATVVVKMRGKGRRLCVKHGEVAALTVALETGTAKRLAQNWRGPGALDFA